MSLEYKSVFRIEFEFEFEHRNATLWRKLMA
jgi:hypothetical protein